MSLYIQNTQPTKPVVSVDSDPSTDSAPALPRDPRSITGYQSELLGSGTGHPVEVGQRHFPFGTTASPNSIFSRSAIVLGLTMQLGLLNNSLVSAQGPGQEPAPAGATSVDDRQAIEQALIVLKDAAQVIERPNNAGYDLKDIAKVIDTFKNLTFAQRAGLIREFDQVSLSEGPTGVLKGRTFDETITQVSQIPDRPTEPINAIQLAAQVENVYKRLTSSEPPALRDPRLARDALELIESMNKWDPATLTSVESACILGTVGRNQDAPLSYFKFELFKAAAQLSERPVGRSLEITDIEMVREIFSGLTTSERVGFIKAFDQVSLTEGRTGQLQGLTLEQTIAQAFPPPTKPTALLHSIIGPDASAIVSRVEQVYTELGAGPAALRDPAFASRVRSLIRDMNNLEDPETLPLVDLGCRRLGVLSANQNAALDYLKIIERSLPRETAPAVAAAPMNENTPFRMALRAQFMATLAAELNEAIDLEQYISDETVRGAAGAVPLGLPGVRPETTTPLVVAENARTFNFHDPATVEKIFSNLPMSDRVQLLEAVDAMRIASGKKPLLEELVASRGFSSRTVEAIIGADALKVLKEIELKDGYALTDQVPRLEGFWTDTAGLSTIKQNLEEQPKLRYLVNFGFGALRQINTPVLDHIQGRIDAAAAGGR